MQTDLWRVKWIDPFGFPDVSSPRKREEADRLAFNLARNEAVGKVWLVHDFDGAETPYNFPAALDGKAVKKIR